jgi:hypothetical protein
LGYRERARDSEKFGARGAVSGALAFAGTKVGAVSATRKSFFGRRDRDTLRVEASEDADRERTEADRERTEADRV